MTDAPDPAALFREMADRIDRNPGEFIGAYLIIGPENKSVSNAVFGKNPNAAWFWGTAKTHIGVESDAIVQEAEEKSRGSNLYGRR